MNSVRMDQMYTRLFRVLQKSLWNTGEATADEAVYKEMKAHAIAPLATSVLSELGLPEELLKKWERVSMATIVHSLHYQRVQDSLPITVPYVILKGTAAAQYYPHPEYRMMGDIDIMTRHEDFAAACGMLLSNGYAEDTNAVDQYLERHRGFTKNNVQIEVHSYYGLRDDKEETRALDDLIIDHITPNHILPDLINGLTLIEHVNHHMEEGLGLRQIIDWMLYVDRCLPDEKWPEFEALARKTGHVQLAMATTRMCEIYLGLREHAWCAGVDPAICENFMAYILSCGNFGTKINSESLISERVLGSASLKAAIITLKQRGVMTWKGAQDHSFLRPFAWVYQAGRYLVKGLARKHPLKQLRTERENSRKRSELFDAIGVAREINGRVVYRDGEYVKMF